MQNFKQFINEEHVDQLHIEVDSKLLENNKDSINADFDRLTSAPYQNAMTFYNQLRGTLERYGMIVPPSATKYFLNFDAELSFTLGDSELNLYVVFNTHKHGKVDGYAQVVNDEELMHLMNSEEDDSEMEDEDYEDEEESITQKYAKRDDDAGNTGEY